MVVVAMLLPHRPPLKRKLVLHWLKKFQQQQQKEVIYIFVAISAVTSSAAKCSRAIRAGSGTAISSMVKPLFFIILKDA
jgi:hypothetical protein